MAFDTWCVLIESALSKNKTNWALVGVTWCIALECQVVLCNYVAWCAKEFLLFTVLMLAEKTNEEKTKEEKIVNCDMCWLRPKTLA